MFIQKLTGKVTRLTLLSFLLSFFVSVSQVALAPESHAQQTSQFGYSSTVQTWTVPYNVTTINISIAGGQGGFGGADSEPGGGMSGYGTVSGTIPVTPGTVIQIAVGMGGNNGDGCVTNIGRGLGGKNPLYQFNGGDGANAEQSGCSGSGGGGGAATVVIINGNTIVAAGGGGSGGGNNCTATWSTYKSAENATTGSLVSATQSSNGGNGIATGSSTQDGGGSGGGGGGYLGGLGGTDKVISGSCSETYGYGGSAGSNYVAPAFTSYLTANLTSVGAYSSAITNCHQNSAQYVVDGNANYATSVGTVAGCGYDGSVNITYSPSVTLTQINATQAVISGSDTGTAYFVPTSTNPATLNCSNIVSAGKSPTSITPTPTTITPTGLTSGTNYYLYECDSDTTSNSALISLPAQDTFSPGSCGTQSFGSGVSAYSIATYGNYCVVSINSASGSNATWTVPSFVSTFNILAVGGGGGGGSNTGGGGGGGGISGATVSNSVGPTLTINVGQGGAGGIGTPGSAPSGSGGGDTTISGNGLAIDGHGGYGGSGDPGGNCAVGGVAGSGGLGSISNGASGGVGGTCGNGGANGSAGYSYTYGGFTATFGGGGGGGAWGGGSYTYLTTSNGGAGGGGCGQGNLGPVTNYSVQPPPTSYDEGIGCAGTQNTGGGGGGGNDWAASGGRGGSGIVIIVYIAQSTVSITSYTSPITAKQWEVISATTTATESNITFNWQYETGTNTTWNPIADGLNFESSTTSTLYSYAHAYNSPTKYQLILNYGDGSDTSTATSTVVTVTVNIANENPTLTLLPINAAYISGAGTQAIYYLNATSGGGNTSPVIYAVDTTTAGHTVNTAGCSIAAGTNQLSYTSIGTCYVYASKATDLDFSAETSSDATVTVSAFHSYSDYVTSIPTITQTLSMGTTPLRITPPGPTTLTSYTYSSNGSSNSITLYGTSLEKITTLNYVSATRTVTQAITIPGTNVTSAVVTDTATAATSITGTGCFTLGWSFTDGNGVVQTGSQLSNSYQYNCAPKFPSNLNPVGIYSIYVETPTAPFFGDTVTIVGRSFTNGATTNSTNTLLASVTVSIGGIANIPATVFSPSATPPGLTPPSQSPYVYSGYQYLTFVLPNSISPGTYPITVYDPAVGPTSAGLSSTTGYSINVQAPSNQVFSSVAVPH